MSGGGLMDFLIALVGLVFVGAIIFMAIDFVSTDERFKRISKFAIGGVLVIAFLLDCKAVFFGGSGGAPITPWNLVLFAIGVIIALVVWYVIVLFLDWAATVFAPLGPFLIAIKFVISAVVLLVILGMAANLLFGMSLGTSSPFRAGPHSQLEMLGPGWGGSLQHDYASAAAYLPGVLIS